MEFLASFTVITIPAALWHVNAEAFRVEGSWARFTAQQFSTLKQTNSLNNWQKEKENDEDFLLIWFYLPYVRQIKERDQVTVTVMAQKREQAGLGTAVLS